MQEKIVGTVMPVLELTLDPGESIFAESGELSWLTESIAMATTTQTGGGGGAMGALKRMAGGSSLFMTAYMAQGASGMVAFGAKLPGQIFPIDVTPQPGAGYRAHRHAFVAGTHGVQLSLGFQQRLEFLGTYLFPVVGGFFQDWIFHHLLVQHFLQLQPVQLEDRDHLDQTGGKDLLLRDL